MARQGKPLAWLKGEIKTPPFSAEARVEAGYLLRFVQLGRTLGMPHSRPMPTIGPRCHEWRVKDAGHEWRLVYRADPDAVVIAEVFAKTTPRTPERVISDCKRRLRMYDEAR
jgi:phage-related protein